MRQIERRKWMGEKKTNRSARTGSKWWYENWVTTSTRWLRLPWLPINLKKRCRGKESKVIARFRCENQERGNTFWKSEDEKKCKKCSQEVETIEHLVERRGWKRNVKQNGKQCWKDERTYYEKEIKGMKEKKGR